MGSLVSTQLQSTGTDKYFCLTTDDCPILAGRGFSACLTIQARSLWLCAHLKVHSGLTRELGALIRVGGWGGNLTFFLLSPCEDRFLKSDLSGQMEL